MKSLRRTFLIPVVSIVVLVGVMAATISFVSLRLSIQRNAEAEVERLTKQALRGLEARFSLAEAVLYQNSSLIGANLLNSSLPDELQKLFAHQIGKFDTPTSIYFGNSNGGVIAVGHEGKKENYYDIMTLDFKAGQFSKREISLDGEIGKTVMSLPNYDARERPWFKRATTFRNEITWGDVYVLFTGHDLAIAPSLSVSNEDGELIGVVGMDIFVSAMSDVLKTENLIEGAVTYIIDRNNGLLISSSDGARVFRKRDDADDFERIAGTASENPIVASSSMWLESQLKSKGATEIVGTMKGVDGNNNSILAASFTGGHPRPNWTIVSVVPESSINSPLLKQLWNSFGVFLFGILVTALVVHRFARKLTEPIEAITSSLDFNTPSALEHVTDGGIRELAFLKESLVAAISRTGESTAKLISEVTQHQLTNKALIEARDDAERANRSKSEFLASMSHELRTPMNAVLGFAQMLKYSPSEALSNRQLEYVNNVIEGGEHLNKLLDDVLDLAKIEADQVVLSVEDVEVEGVVSDSVTMISTLALEHEVDIINNVIGDSCQTLLSDPARLKQVLLNLLTNAIKYNHPGGSVTIDGAVGEHEFYRLSVKDTGIGIPKDEQDKIFEMFHRLGADPMIAREGVGIGLSVSKPLVDKMSGQMGVESEEGAGSTFWIELPLASNEEVLIWTDEYKVGIDTIDADHQVIFSLTNVLSQNRVGDDELDSAIEELIEYTEYHFDREEQIMAKCGYPDLDAHQQRHLDLIGQINEIANSWRVDKSPTTRHILRVFLKNWWIGHITNVDKTIAEYVDGRD